jgi:hypothetical protein
MILRATLCALLAVIAVGCAPGDGEVEEGDETETETDPLSSGVNGGACLKSPYNCKLRVSGGNRVENAQGGLWAVQDDDVVDGNGDLMGVSTWDHLRFNYGQTRHINGRTYAFAMSTNQNSSGWFPLDAVVSEDILRDRIGEVNAKGSGLDKMACYAVKNSDASPSRAALKVVYDTDSDNERVGDYLALVRKNGGRYINLAFNVPGFGLGGVAVDIYPAGTKFQRLEVPTDSGAPSIDIPVWKKDGAGRYRKEAGEMKFIYGYVVADDGTRRNGWMAYEALKTSSGCP